MASKDGNQAEVRLSVVDPESEYIEQEMMKLRDTAPFEAGAHQQILIQRVPAKLRAQNVDLEKHFEPSHVALGPIHHKDPRFEQGEELKLSLAARFIKVSKVSDELLFNNIRAEINFLRICYNPDDVKDYDNEKLAWMLFVDGCAVLCLTYFFDSRLSKFEEEQETQFWQRQMRDDVSISFIDLMLLENQLPFQVLRILMDSTNDFEIWASSIKNFIIGMSRTILGGQRRGGDVDLSGRYTLLELLREHLSEGYILKMLYERMNYGRIWPFHEMHDTKVQKIMTSVTDLKESGIQVRPFKYPVGIGNISFSSKLWGTLNMPVVTVHQSTTTMFMNLVALETCSPDYTCPSFKSYICFIASLIQTPQDVKELRVAGMLRNYLGNDEDVACFFNTMSKGLVPDPYTYSAVRTEINDHCNSRFIRLLET